MTNNALWDQTKRNKISDCANFRFFVFPQNNKNGFSLHCLHSVFSGSSQSETRCTKGRKKFFLILKKKKFFPVSFLKGYNEPQLHSSGATVLESVAHGHSHGSLEVPHVHSGEQRANKKRKREKERKKEENIPKKQKRREISFFVHLVLVVDLFLFFSFLIFFFFFFFFSFLVCSFFKKKKKKNLPGPEPPPRHSGHAPLRMSAQVQPVAQYQVHPVALAPPTLVPAPAPVIVAPSVAASAEYPPSKPSDVVEKEKAERAKEEEESKPAAPTYPLEIQVKTDFGHIEALREAPLRALLTLRATENFSMPKPHLDLVILMNRSTSEDTLFNFKHAVEYILSQLGPLDRLAVLSFEEDVQTLVPMDSVARSYDAITKAWAAVDACTVGNGKSNLCAGLKSALQLIEVWGKKEWKLFFSMFELFFFVFRRRPRAALR